MFYHTLLLQPQHKMQLSLPWIAATLGVKTIKKEDVIKCNVIKVCDHILLFVTSDSLNPNKRFSLRLSAILINGISLILRQQVKFLRDEIDRILLAREKTAERLLKELAYDEAETPPTPKPTIKKKKTKQPLVETPESLVDRIELVARGRKKSIAEPEFNMDPLRMPEVTGEEAILQARVDEITLRDEVPRPQEPTLMDDFGALEIPVPIPSTSIAQELAVVLERKPEEPIVEEMIPPPVVPLEDLLREERVVPEVRIEEAQELEVVPPAEREPAIQVIPEVEVTPAPLPEKEADKDKEEGAEKEKKKDKRASPVQKKKPSDVMQMIMVEPEVQPEGPKEKRERNIAASLLLKRQKRRFVFIDQQMQIYQDEPEFVPITNIIPDFKPMTKFWPDWETMQLEGEAVRPARDTGSLRASGATEGSLGLRVSKTAETPEAPSAASIPLLQQIETPSVVTTPGPTYISTPRKRPLPSDETVEEVLAPAANGDMRAPETLPRKRKKVVSVEEVQAAEQPLKEGRPEDQLELAALELPELAISEIPEIPQPPEERRREPVEKEKSPEKRAPRDVEEVTPPRKGYEAEDAFGIKWSGRIMRVVSQHDKIRPAEICKAINKKLTKLNMSILFATLLALAKDRYVLLHSAEDSCELEYVERGPKEFDF